MQIRIPYGLNDITMATQVDHVMVDGTVDTVAGTIELRTYASVLPLAPGDVLRITGWDEFHQAFVATEMATQRECWMLEIAGHTPDPGTHLDDDLEWAQAELSFDQVEREIADMAQVCRPSTFSLLVATDDRTWLDAYIRGSHAIARYAVLRQPHQKVNLAYELGLAGAVVNRPTFTADGIRLW